MMLIEPRGHLGSNDLDSELAASDTFTAKNRPMLISSCAHVGGTILAGELAAGARRTPNVGKRC
jgi:hypothetical protein